MVRFDVVYVQHFKTNLKMVKDYPNMLGYVREIYQMADGAVRATTSVVGRGVCAASTLATGSPQCWHHMH